MRKSLYGFILACLFVTGCKEAADKPAGSSDNGGGETAQTTPDNKPGRSGKVDLNSRRRPALPDKAEGAGSGSGSGAGDQVSKESVEDRRARRLQQFDTDGDGKISDDERKAARHKRAEDMRTKADANGDGKVTIEEMQNSSGGFRRMDPNVVDTNKDGEVSVDELETALENRSKQWGGGRMGRVRDRLRNRNGGGGAPQPEAPAQPN